MQDINSISINALFERYGEKLCLTWIAGSHGGNRSISPEEKYGEPVNSEVSKVTHAELKPLAGQLNLVRPQQIQIFGPAELDYLHNRSQTGLEDIFNQLFSSQPACILIAEDCSPPPLLTLKCNEYSVPLFSSSLSGYKLAELLRYYLQDLLAETAVLNGVFMEVMDAGVLITGASGIGKSELALELIARGHRLIADDAARFSRLTPDTITGTCPEILKDFLEVRGLGIINVRHIYGDNSIKDKKHLHLIVRLEPMDRPGLLKLDRLDGSYNIQNILEVHITEITLPVAPGRNLAVLLECAVRNHILRTKGYNAPEEFIKKQLDLIHQKND